MGDLLPYLDSLFASKTIPPSFKIPHVLYAIWIIGANPQGVGRYRIKNNIELGEASTKTLLNHLKKIGLIDIQEQNQKGHTLTTKGREFYNLLNQRISSPQLIENSNNKYVVGEIGAFINLKAQYLKKNITIDIKPRDEAIKIGGTGATVVVFDGSNLIFPDSHSNQPVTLEWPFTLEGMKTGDLVVIGGGHTNNHAILACIAAALVLLDL